MIRSVVLLFACMIGFSQYSHSQHEYMLWAKASVDGKIVKPLKWNVELNSRFGSTGLETFFPQVGFEYKVMKWLRPSIEYRYVLDKDRYGNFLAGNRLNFNLGLRSSIDRWKVKGRFRYQYAFNSFASDEAVDLDFDQAVRTKFGVEYDINNSIFSPTFTAELFYNPVYGLQSPGFDKIRLTFGSALELDGPHDVSFKYQLDKRFDYSRDLRHVLSLSYGYSL